jgi:hypothetical protein
MLFASVVAEEWVEASILQIQAHLSVTMEELVAVGDIIEFVVFCLLCPLLVLLLLVAVARLVLNMPVILH